MYAGSDDAQEVTVDGYRIDAIRGDALIEVQCASLSAIRPKIRSLVHSHDVIVVKPLASRKYLLTRESRRGELLSSRYSPVRETLFHVFHELVHFVNVFPHRRLTLEVILAEWEEHRVPARRRYRQRYTVVDRSLRHVESSVTLRTAADLLALLPATLPAEFTTVELAAEAEVPRWLAQKAAYCLRKMNAIDVLGKRAGCWLYGKRRSKRKPAA